MPAVRYEQHHRSTNPAQALQQRSPETSALSFLGQLFMQNELVFGFPGFFRPLPARGLLKKKKKKMAESSCGRKIPRQAVKESAICLVLRVSIDRAEYPSAEALHSRRIGKWRRRGARHKCRSAHEPHPVTAAAGKTTNRAQFCGRGAGSPKHPAPDLLDAGCAFSFHGLFLHDSQRSRCFDARRSFAGNSRGASSE